MSLTSFLSSNKDVRERFRQEFEKPKFTSKKDLLDPIYRSGFVDENIGTVYKEEVADLQKLISLVNPNLFKAQKICSLNPTFGKGSVLVGGADADLLMGCS